MHMAMGSIMNVPKGQKGHGKVANQKNKVKENPKTNAVSRCSTDMSHVMVHWHVHNLSKR